jgi:uncharacterized membrane protein required for colicin V production
MLTHLIKSINWVDAALVFLFIRMIFVGIKNGFISEFFKFLGVVAAVFVSLHYYSFLAAWVAEKTNFSWDYWNLVIFAGLWFAVTFFFKLFRDGILLLFKAETIHQGFDKYAAGIVAVARGILVCSLTIFLILLTYNGPVTRMTLHSYSYKIAGRAGVSTYSFLYNNLVSKLFAGEHFNTAAPKVLHPDGD